VGEPAPRNHVTFEANLPDDSEEDDRGNVTVPAGRSIASVLVRALESQGLDCSAPEQHSHYGWSFEIRINGSRVWCVLQYAEPWLLMVRTHSSLTEPERTALRSIHDALKGEALFSEVLWLTEKEYDAPGDAADAKRGHPSPD